MVFNSQNGQVGLNVQWFGAHTIKGIQKISTATKTYNLIAEKSIANAQKYATTVGACDEKLGAYLKNLNGAKASVANYSASLIGARIQTVALQAATMLLNAALTWGISVGIQLLIEFGKHIYNVVSPMGRLKKSIEDTENAIENANDAIGKYESTLQELETVENRLEEIRLKISEINDSTPLSLTDKAELETLRAETRELERQKAILETNAKEGITNVMSNADGVIEKYDNLVDTVDNYKAPYTSSWISYIPIVGTTLDLFIDTDGEKKKKDDARATVDEAKRDLEESASVVRQALQTLWDSGYRYQNGSGEFDAKIEEYEQFLYDNLVRDEADISQLSKYLISMSKYQDEIAQIKEQLAEGTFDVAALESLFNSNEDFKELFISLIESGALGEDFKEAIAGSDGVVSAEEAAKISTDDFKNALPLLTNELNKAEDAAEDAETSFKSIAKTLSDGLDKLSNKKDILSEVKEELDSFGAISADNISKILEQFSDNDDVQKAVAYYLSGIGTAQQVYDAMSKGYQNDLKLQAKKIATQMQNDENYFKALAKLHGDFSSFTVSNQKIDISNCENLAKAKLKIENTLIGTFKNNWGKYYTWVNSISTENIDAQIKSIEEALDRMPSRIAKPEVRANLEAALAELKAIKKDSEFAIDELILNEFDSSGFNASLSTDFDKDSGKTEAEKYFDKLKYKLETNQITQEQYLKDLDWGYKHFYNKTAEYLEDYAKYSQEVYDGFKDMYKEDLEAQKDMYKEELEAQKEAWEEKKDAVSEYYDNLREQIKNAHDEEDYEKEQSEKRKEIFDLDMQIAELMRDGSEKAKARIAELEEERLKAEEELLDFETDKAREDELSRLEKEQEAEEKKIQDQIDTIDKELETIDEDIVSVRNAIINYAAKKGVTLDFAYASGTRSSVGGFGRINEKGIEMISAPDGNGNYIPMLPGSYVFSAKATEFLWKLATEHSLPQAMYNSIAKSIKAQSNTPSVNIAQPITITMGDVIIKGNADKQTVADIKKQQENTVRMVLQKIKELQK